MSKSCRHFDGGSGFGQTDATLDLSGTSLLSIYFDAYVDIDPGAGNFQDGCESSSNYNNNDGALLLFDWGEHATLVDWSWHRNGVAYNGGRTPKPLTHRWNSFCLMIDVSSAGTDPQVFKNVVMNGADQTFTRTDTSDPSVGNFGNYTWFWAARNGGSFFFPVAYRNWTMWNVLVTLSEAIGMTSGERSPLQIRPASRVFHIGGYGTGRTERGKGIVMPQGRTNMTYAGTTTMIPGPSYPRRPVRRKRLAVTSAAAAGHLFRNANLDGLGGGMQFTNPIGG